MLTIDGLLRIVLLAGFAVPGRAAIGRSLSLTASPSTEVKTVPGGRYVIPIALCIRVTSPLVVILVMVISPAAEEVEYDSMGMRRKPAVIIAVAITRYNRREVLG